MAHELVVLGAAFLLAGLIARGGVKVGLPTIPLFMAAGILVGPHTPGPVLFDRPADLELLAAFGLIFLMFSLGFEFSVDDLTGGGRKLLIAAAVYLGLNVGIGIGFGFALGWGAKEALIVAGVIGISSSAIVSKVLIELHRVDNPESRVILGIIVIEDLFLALFLAALAPVLGQVDTVAEGLFEFAKAAAFLIVLGLLARYGGRYVGYLVGARDDELLVVTFVGLALLTAGVAHAVGVSDAVGAFMAGVVLAATASASRIEHLVLPLRDAFGAVFFFAFGLSIDPADARSVAVPVLVATAITLVVAVLAGGITARVHRLDRLAAVNISATLMSRGEFALILVSLAAAAGLDPRLSPFVALYVLIFAVASPILASRSAGLATVVPRSWFPVSAAGTPIDDR